MTATADPFLFNNPGGTMRFGKIDGAHIDFLFTPTGGGATTLFVHNGSLFQDSGGLGLTLTPPVGFAWAGLKDADGTLSPVTASFTDTTSNVTLTTTAGSSTLTLNAPSTINFPHGHVWTAVGFRASGRFLYSSTRVVTGLTPPYPEPYWRWNVFGTQVLGDTENGVVSTTASQGTITWETSQAWHFHASGLDFFTGTWSGNTLVWNDGTTWTLATLDAATITQELRANYGSSTLSWYQEGVLQTQSYHVEGTQLRVGPSSTQVAANYNESTGQLTFTSGGYVWTKRGSIPKMPAQELIYQPGHSNSVLYLMMEGGSCGLNTRGPGYQTTTVAKLQLDPTSPVSHTETMRAHRYVEIPPGVLSQVTFFVRTADGSPVDLTALGASISFVMTISTREGG